MCRIEVVSRIRSAAELVPIDALSRETGFQYLRRPNENVRYYYFTKYVEG